VTHHARTFVLIATYNERENIVHLIERVLELPEALEVLVVDDSSPDGTADLVRERFRGEGRVHVIVRSGDRGYGSSMVEGFRWCLGARAGRVLTMDADFAHDPGAIPSLLEASEVADLVIGSRYAGGVRVLNWSPQRLLLSMFANRYARTILGSKVRVMTSGFRCYRREVLEAIDMGRVRARGYAFLVQMLYCAEQAGFRVREVPIVYTERRAGQSKMSKSIMLESALVPWKLLLSRGGARRGRVSGT